MWQRRVLSPGSHYRRAVRLRQRLVRALGLMDHSVTVVVFTVPESRLRELDVALGPCVPESGRKRPLVGSLRQDGGEYPEQTAALYTVLTGRPSDEALRLLAQEGDGRLFAANPAFVAAMSAAHEHLEALKAQARVSGDNPTSSWHREWEALGQRWLREGGWPRTVTATTHRLGRLYWAHMAQQKGQQLYVWHGPEVPMYDVEVVRKSPLRKHSD